MSFLNHLCRYDTVDTNGEQFFAGARHVMRYYLFDNEDGQFVRFVVTQELKVGTSIQLEDGTRRTPTWIGELEIDKSDASMLHAWKIFRPVLVTRA